MGHGDVHAGKGAVDAAAARAVGDSEVGAQHYGALGRIEVAVAGHGVGRAVEERVVVQIVPGCRRPVPVGVGAGEAAERLQVTLE